MRKMMLALLTLLLVVGLVPAAAADSRLAAARAATARYHDIDAALADGYVSTVECVALPSGEAMGVHFIKPALLDTTLDVRQPEVLLYEPRANGKGFRLVGVEYLQVDSDQDLSTSDGTIFLGQPLVGPMPGHGPGMPIHQELHVWVWRHNPAGMFAEFNAAVRCP